MDGLSKQEEEILQNEDPMDRMLRISEEMRAKANECLEEMRTNTKIIEEIAKKIIEEGVI